MLRRNGPVVKSVESVLRLEGSLWGKRFVEEVRVIEIFYCISLLKSHLMAGQDIPKRKRRFYSVC